MSQISIDAQPPVNVTVTYADLFTWAKTVPTIINDVLCYTPDIHDPDHNPVEYYASGEIEGRPLSRYLRAYASYDVVSNPDAISFDPMKLHIVDAITTLITNEYETYNDHTAEPDAIKLWDVFQLGGDDDVDYHGSYIDITLDVLRAYCDAHNIKHDREPIAL